MPASKNSAVFFEGDAMPAAVAVRDVPTYQANPRELVVRVEAAGFNPSDYKFGEGFVPLERPYGIGSDVVGIVEQIGDGVQDFAVGDRVAGYTPFQYSCIISIPREGLRQPNSRYAAFQRQTVVYADGVFKVPPRISVPEAATLGCAYMTAALGLWHDLGYEQPSLTGVPQSGRAISTLLVWGGSSSVGAYAIQFARLSGIRVVATASPHNFEYVRSLGADKVYDYRASDVVEKLRDEGIDNVFDAISEQESPRQIRDVLSGKGGRVAVVLSVNIEWPPEIKEYRIAVPNIFKDEYKELVRWLYHDFSARFIGEGIIKPNNIHLVEGSLEQVKEMLYLQKEGKVSGKKPVLMFKD